MKKLLSYINSLDKESRAAFCSSIDASERYLRKAISKGQRMGVELCIAIDRNSGGAVRCEDIRPDVDWAYLRTSQATSEA
jgi:DNA-binding transcriptional regulator YdaS (Cro superfamily)